MVQTGGSEFRILSDALKSQRDLDEDEQGCLEVLQQRLERLKGLGGAYSAIDFSPGLKRRQGRKPVGILS